MRPLQEQDDAIRYLDDSKLQGRAIRVEKVPQPPTSDVFGGLLRPQLQLFIQPSPLHKPPILLPGCMTFPPQSPHPSSSAAPNPEELPVSAAFTASSHLLANFHNQLAYGAASL